MNSRGAQERVRRGHAGDQGEAVRRMKLGLRHRSLVAMGEQGVLKAEDLGDAALRRGRLHRTAIASASGDEKLL